MLFLRISSSFSTTTATCQMGVQSKISNDCVIPENIHTFPMEGIFSKTHPPPPITLEIPTKSSSYIFFFDLTEPPTPRIFQSLLRVWTFFGIAHFHKWYLHNINIQLGCQFSLYFPSVQRVSSIQRSHKRHKCGQHMLIFCQ